MPDTELDANSKELSTAKLLAIVSVEHADRVRCGQPTCGHSVYRRIHVVRENGKLMVLGSTCFGKRYGDDAALGSARFGGGEGRPLTQAERELLVNNTEALLQRFEEEAARVRDAKVEKTPTPMPPSPERVVTQITISERPRETPWAWVKPWSSVIYLKLKDGSGWMRAQRNDDKHILVPWPKFEGWDEALPPLFGPIDSECGGHVLPDVVAALSYLRSHAKWETKPGRWSDVLREIASRTVDS